jgi:hypothetical protein
MGRSATSMSGSCGTWAVAGAPVRSLSVAGLLLVLAAYWFDLTRQGVLESLHPALGLILSGNL